MISGAFLGILISLTGWFPGNATIPAVVWDCRTWGRPDALEGMPVSVEFSKYHGLGNDYLVFDPQTAALALSTERIRLLCDRHYGLGSDGILLGPLAAHTVVPVAAREPAAAASETPSFGLRVYNPDGSEAEKSGNGLRIFARYLWDTGRVAEVPFDVLTLGGRVRCQVLEQGKQVNVDMGRVSFFSGDIPVAGPAREVLKESITVADRTLTYCAASIGNPHCVVLCHQASVDDALELGPQLETDPRFPQRTNVQFMQVLDRNNIAIEIWERGAGYTLASGSSAAVSAAVAKRLGLCDADIAVRMPGGTLGVHVDDRFQVTIIGPVAAVARGTVAPELIQ